VRNIQTYNAPGPRRYIGINLWGLGGGCPDRLYIRSDRVEYLALLCPVHISALPPLCLFHPSSRHPSLATDARCSFLRLRFACFCLGSKLRLARYECQSSSPPNKNHYFPRLTNASLEMRPSNSLRTIRDFGKEERVSKRIFHGRLKNFTDE